MNTRACGLSFVALVGLVLSGCAAEVEPGQDLGTSRGTIDLAVSQTCSEGSDPLCVAVDGQFVMSPRTFEPAAVKDAAVTESDGQNAVDVTFTDEGAIVLKALAADVVETGSEARLVMKVGDQIRSAVAVAGPLTGSSVMIVLPSDDSAQEVVDLITND